MISKILNSFKSLSKNDVRGKNNIPPSLSDAGAQGHGTVVFAIVATVPCSGLFRKPSKSSELFEG
ncbi:MAG TPA: hypothetical protein DHV29_13400 [Bacteroidales bacterium]|nr:MAG: hypothetical protein A2W94_08420 [Bacteroidetes bacterium GWE2_42_42]HCB63725.1 hypothetical protein [Bacteroidales bacterium]HCY24474.1 hypothetical protein [Bacteroidales bacterium]